MKLFSKLFGGKKESEPQKGKSDQELIALFMKRSELWDLSFTPEVIQFGINQCKAEARVDDEVFKLPELYGSMVIFQAEKGNVESKAFLDRAINNGASEEDFATWWNSEDILRRMMEWELEMRKHKRFQELIADNDGLDEDSAIIQVRKELPEFGEPNDYFGKGVLDKYLPVELQFRVDQMLRGFTVEEREAIVQYETSMNAYLYRLLMPDVYVPEEQQLKTIAEAALNAFEAGDMDEAWQLANQFKTNADRVWGKKNWDYISIMVEFASIFMHAGDYLTPKEFLTYYLEKIGEDHEGYAIRLSSLGQLYLEMGRVKKAIKTQGKAYQIQLKLTTHQEFLPRILNNYALALSTNTQYDEAVPKYLEALKGAEKHYGKNHSLYALFLSNLTVAYLLNNQFKEALKPAIESINIRAEVLGTEHLDYAESLEILGNIYMQLGDCPKALEVIETARDIREKVLSDKHPDYILSMSNLAMIHIRSGNKEVGIQYMKKGIDLRFQHFKVIFPHLPEKQKEKLLKHVQLEFETYLDYSISEAKTFPKNLSDALNIRLKTKGMLLEYRQNLKDKIARIDNPKLNKLYQKFILIRQELAASYEIPIHEREDAKVEQLELEFKKKEKELQEEASRYQINRADIVWTDIQKSLAPQEVAIEVIQTNLTSKGGRFGASQYAFLMITPDCELPICIKIDDGNSLETEFKERYALSIKTKYPEKRAMLDEGDDDDFFCDDETNGELYDAFWGAIASEIKGYNKVYFSPDGVYHEINIQTLFDAESGKFLLDQWEIHVLGNLKDLLSSKQTNHQYGTQTAYMIGAPDYLAGIPEDKREQPRISYLPGTKQEVQQIEGMLKHKGWQVIAHYDEEANEEIINAELPSCMPQILHFSTHGFFQKNTTRPKKQLFIRLPYEKLEENPLLRSGLLLAGAEKSLLGINDGHKDGVLTAFEVLNFHLYQTELVTLSACETGLGEVENGEGVYGLQRAFQLAGARAVLMSMWKVPDKETKELMVRFYELWLESGEKRSAFRKAQQEMKEKYPEPYYWGAFVMIGA